MIDNTARSSFTISQKGKIGQKEKKSEPTEDEKGEESTRQWKFITGHMLFILTGLLLVILTIALTAYNWPSFVRNPEEYSRTPRQAQLQHADSANASLDNTNITLDSTNIAKDALKQTQKETIPVTINVTSSSRNSSVQNVDTRSLTKTATPTAIPTAIPTNTNKPDRKPNPNTNISTTSDPTNHKNSNLRPHLNPNINANFANQRLSENLKGNSTFVQNKTIYGAIIMTDYSEKPHIKKTKIKLQNSTSETDVMQVAVDLSSTRSKNSRDMIAQLPFPVIHWPPVFSKACPYSATQHKSERGLLYAHLQIWLDFVYFDYDVKMKAGGNNEKNGESEKKAKGIYMSDDTGYAKGTFTTSENGTLYKNGSPYRDENILVVFEDDADIAVIDVQNALYNELSNMTTDLLFLGWCSGRFSSSIPLCAHAYALTMAGARKAIKYLEPCGSALDEQFVIFGRNKWITHREAFPSSYTNKFNSNYPVPGDKTRGIFHQKKMGSFNGH